MSPFFLSIPIPVDPYPPLQNTKPQTDKNIEIWLILTGFLKKKIVLCEQKGHPMYNSIPTTIGQSWKAVNVDQLD